MDAMQPDALLTSGSAMPDQQQLYQQHLAHWQAAFGEYWKCCASQGAALPQQWQVSDFNVITSRVADTD
jgi:hypothetical protein